jgi:hypothetical protein
MCLRQRLPKDVLLHLIGWLDRIEQAAQGAKHLRCDPSSFCMEREWTWDPQGAMRNNSPPETKRRHLVIRGLNVERCEGWVLRGMQLRHASEDTDDSE